MNLESDLPQQAPRINPRQAILIVVAIVITAVAAGTAGYALGRRASQSVALPQPQSSIRFPSVSLPSPPEESTSVTRVIIQNGYSFEAAIPNRYKVINGAGDYVKYITSANGQKIIGFYISTGGGELHPTGQIEIDGVLFTVEQTQFDGRTIGCPASLYGAEARFKRDHLYFGINTWCMDGDENQKSIYEQIIRSIRFSENLRAVLSGATPPLLNTAGRAAPLE